MFQYSGFVCVCESKGQERLKTQFFAPVLPLANIKKITYLDKPQFCQSEQVQQAC